MTSGAQDHFRWHRFMTFGVELEFIIIIRKTALITWNQNRGIGAAETLLHRNDYMRQYIVCLLSTPNVDPYNPAQLPPPPYTWQNMVLGPVALTEPKESDYRYWSVCKESSVGAFTADLIKEFGHRNAPQKVVEFDEEFWYDGAELVSSVLCTEAAFQWTHQLERINKLLQPSNPSPIWISPLVPMLCKTPRKGGCGVHVHIGYGPVDIPWKVIQTIYILWAIYEPEIEELQPVERRSEYNNYAASLRSTCPMFTYKKFAHGIMATNSPAHLTSILTSPGRSSRDLKIGISQARGDGLSPGSKRQTLEFREGYGTLDDTAIKYWVKFIEAVVRLAQSIVDINFDLVEDLYDMGRGKPGLVVCESIFDHICLVNLDQEGRDFFERQKRYFAALGAPSEDDEE